LPAVRTVPCINVPLYKIGVIASHPIQYQAPIFRELNERAELLVYFAHRDTPEDQASEGFGVAFKWDRDLTEGYDYRFLENHSKKPSFSRFFGCITPEIFTIIREKNFDAVLVMGWNLYSYWQAVIACKITKTPVMVRGDSTLYTSRSRLRSLIKWLPYRLMFRLFDRFLYVGKNSKEYYEFYGVDKNRLFFSPHSVDNHWFRAKVMGLEKSKVRKKYGIDKDDFIILCVGKLVKEKRPSDVIDAVSGLDRQCAIVYVGSGEEEPVLIEGSRAKGVRSYFLGFKNQTEMPECYLLSDVLVLPSASETWGLVVNEAMACGIPAIVSDAVGCAKDLVEEGVTGFSYPVADVNALRKILSILIDNYTPEQYFHSVQNRVMEYTPAHSSLGILSACKSVCHEYNGS